jgi:ABC-type glycerol-3-phosphate transport system substrate-binding protein
VRTALAAGNPAPFDIIHADDAFLIELAAEGWLLPLDDLIETYTISYNLDDLSPGAMDLAQLNGQTYGIPIVANTMHLFYRQDLLEKYNLPVPETYDDIIAACQVLATEESLDLPFTMNLHADWAWRVEFHNFLKSFGGHWLNEDNTPAFNGPEGVAAVEKMLAVIEACMGQTGLSYSIDDSEAALENGSLAMANIWASRAANMDKPELSQMVGQISFAPAPQALPGGPYSGPAAADFYVIPALTQHDPDLIFRIIMEAIDLQSQLQGAQYGIVTRQAVAEQGAGGRYFEAALSTINAGAGNYGPNPAVFLARSAIETHLPQVANGALSPQEALNAAAEQYLQEAQAQGFLP